LFHIYFFGGGRLLSLINSELCKKKYNKIKQFVFISKRHANEKIEENLTFKDFLIRRKINFKILNKVDKKIKNKIQNNSIAVSFGSSWIFDKKTINLFKNKFYNVHGSDLPEDRGGGGFSWQILSNSRVLTSTIHFLSPGIDKGKIIFKNKITISNKLLPLERQQIYEKRNKIFFMKKLKKLFKSNLKSIRQNEDKSTYWPRLNSQIHGWIDWKWSSKEILLFSNAFDDPYEGAKTKLNNKTVFLKKCFIQKTKGTFHPFQTGIIIRKNKNYLSVSCKNTILSFKEILNSKKKRISLKDIKIGDRFHTPSSILEKALETRFRYK
jgi:methionyl-tRNA formyltransferase